MQVTLVGILILIVLRTYPRVCHGVAHGRGKAARGEAAALRARGEAARGAAASCRGKAARGEAAYNLVLK